MLDSNNNNFEIRKEDYQNYHLKQQDDPNQEDDWDKIVEIQLNLPKSNGLNASIRSKSTHEIAKTEKYISSILNGFVDNNSNDDKVEHVCCFPIFSKKSSNSELNKIYFIASLPYNTNLVNYTQILRDIYCTLTNTYFKCEASGSHWEVIGFQSSNPSTDLRALSMLCLLTIHKFCTSDNFRQTSQCIYQLSLDESQNFPFCLLCMNVITILYGEIKQNQNVQNYLGKHEDILNNFFQLFACLMQEFYMIWKNENKTIMDSHDTLSRLKEMLRNNFKSIVSKTKQLTNEQNYDSSSLSHVDISVLRSSQRY